MARPAIRVIDGHLCPAHGPDKLSPDGSPNVRVNSQESARAGDAFLCKGIMNRIATGASTVTVNGEFAARALDGSDHKGTLVFGSGNVVIGGPTGMGCIGAAKKACQQAAAGRSSGAVRQSYGNCMPESLRQIICRATGVQVKEDDVLNYGLANTLSKFNPGFGNHGATSAASGAKILNDYGVPAEVVPAAGHPTMNDIKQAISDRRGVVATFNSAGIWPPGLVPTTHAALVTGVEVDDDGNVTAVFLNDTGLGECGRKVSADKFAAGMNALKDYHPLVVTKGHIW